MKNSFYILLIFGFVISSCGTSKQYTSSEYGDAIYNNSPEKVIVLSTATDEGMANLKQQTKELGRTTVNGYDAKVVYVNDEGAADIVVDGENSYLILDSTMSFEERLTKFRSPNYNINIYISDRWGWDDSDYYSPWWYMSSNPWFYRNRMDRYYGSNYYYDWWGSPFSRWGSRYYDPWSYGYSGYYGYNSWYGYYGYGYYGYPFNRYYNNYGYYGWYGNHNGDWYSGGGHSGGHSSDRSRYIGKRVDNYRSPGSNNNGPSRGVVKNSPRIEQIGGTRVGNTSTTREGSVYRRENKTGTSGVIHNTEVVNPTRSTGQRSTGQTERTGTTYRRPSSEARVNSTGNTDNRSNNTVSRTESSYRRSSTSVESYRAGNSQAGSSVRSTNSPSRSSSSYDRNSSSYERNSSASGSSSVRSSNTGSSSSSTSTSSSSSSSSSGSGSTYRR